MSGSSLTVSSASGIVSSRVTFRNCACVAFRSSGRTWDGSPASPPLYFSLDKAGQGITAITLFTPVSCTVNSSTGVITNTATQTQNYIVSAQGTIQPAANGTIQMYFTKTTAGPGIPTSGGMLCNIQVATGFQDFNFSSFLSLALNETVSFAVNLIDSTAISVSNLIISLRPANY